MTPVALFASPVTAHPDVCQTFLQTFGVGSAALQDDLVDFKIVPRLKQEFVDEKNDPVLFGTTKIPVRKLRKHLM